jgi:hypothetical protein
MKKTKKVVPFFFISVGIVGLILFIFGLQFNGTLSNDIKMAGLVGLGIFGLWAVVNIANAYADKKELENL